MQILFSIINACREVFFCCIFLYSVSSLIVNILKDLFLYTVNVGILNVLCEPHDFLFLLLCYKWELFPCCDVKGGDYFFALMLQVGSTFLAVISQVGTAFCTVLLLVGTTFLGVTVGNYFLTVM